LPISRAPIAAAFLTLAAWRGYAQESFVQPDETLPGFKPGNLLEAHGIDNVNPFSGDVGIVIPLGPEYTLSSAMKWQLKAYYSPKLWRMDSGLCTAVGYEDTRHAYLRGDPTIGTGWTLNPGYVGYSASGDVVKFGYFSPDGGFHQDGTDGSHIRIQSQGSPPTSYTVEFPDGSRHTFGHSFQAPRPTSGASFDFTELSWTTIGVQLYSTRYGLTQIEDGLRNVVLQVSYDANNPWQISSITLPTLGQSISFAWTNFNANNVYWQVLDHADFPIFGSTREHLRFDYQVTTFTRNSYDNSNLSDRPLHCINPTPPVAVPLLWKITLTDFGYLYTMTYFALPLPTVQEQGALQQIALPTGGAINYTYDRTAPSCSIPGCSPEAASGGTAPQPALGVGQRTAEWQGFVDSSVGVATRCESTSTSSCPSTATTSYSRRNFVYPCNGGYPACGDGNTWDPFRAVRRVDVTAPGNDPSGSGPGFYMTRYYFHVSGSTEDPIPRDGGIELERRTYTDATTTTVARDVVSCWTPVGGSTTICGYHAAGDVTNLAFSAMPDLPPKQSEVTWYGVVPSGFTGGVCPTASTPCKGVTHGPMSTDYDTQAQQFRTTTTSSANLTSGGPPHTSYTHWTSYIDASHWFLNPFDEKDETENGVTVFRGFEFDTTYADLANGNRVMPGFPRGTWTSDKPMDSSNRSLLLECRYPDSAGNEKWQFSATYASSALPGPPPYAHLCSGVYAQYPIGTPGGNGTTFAGDSFGHVFGFGHPGLANTGKWVVGGSVINSVNTPGTIGWFHFNVTRDIDSGAGSGLIASSTSASNVTTNYNYDALGRLASVSPPASEYPTFVCYDMATRTTVYRAPASVACPTSGFSGSIQTWQQYLYDGLGRLVREIRGMPTSAGSYAVRTHSFDGAGHTIFDSEWSTCTDPASSSSPSGCLRSLSQGTAYQSFDPFGRIQSVRRADGSTVGTSFTDGSILSSDTKKAVTVNNINGNCTGTCTGGTSATTAYAYDVYGRPVTVTEPTGDPTSYAYDPNGKLSCVKQGGTRDMTTCTGNPGGQWRKFDYTNYGFLRSQTTPEAGTVDSSGTLSNGNLKIGSLGNVEERTEAFGSAHPKTHDLAYDPAGRVLSESVGGVRYVMNCYDGSGVKALCPDNVTSNFSGGANPKGNLTRRVGSNPTLSPFPTVQEDYNYSGQGGRLSTLSTTIAGGPGQIDESWMYNGLGLVAHQARPRFTGGTQVPTIVSTLYTAGLPTSIYVNGLPAVTGIDYAASGALRDYTTGFFTGRTIKTTIAEDTTGMPRPGSISTSGRSASSLGTYFYDGAGNIACTTSGTGCASGQIDTFTYDNRSRLTQATLATAGTQSYSYDAFGNLLSKGSASFCTGSCTNNRMPAPYAYDERGNLTASPAEGYTYDDMNRTTTAMATTAWSYFYGGGGERVARYQPSTTSWTYTYRDEADRVATEFAGASPSIDNVFLGNQVVASYANGAVGGNDHVWAFYSSDHLGTPRYLSEINGQFFETRKYWPYGEQVLGTSLLGHVRFAAMERDTESGMNNDRYFDHARHHGSGLGRFLSSDKAQGKVPDPQSWNRYAYARNNPVKFIDKNGLEFGYPGGGAELHTAVLKFEATYNRSEPAMAALGQRIGQTLAPEAALGTAAAIATITTGANVLAQIYNTSRALTPETSADSQTSTVKPGPHAGRSIPARGPQPKFNSAERSQINDIGSETGCHSCGTTDPGTKSGNFVPDHQDPTAFNEPGEPQRLYPQCLDCSRKQGLEIIKILRSLKDVVE